MRAGRPHWPKRAETSQVETLAYTLAFGGVVWGCPFCRRWHRSPRSGVLQAVPCADGSGRFLVLVDAGPAEKIGAVPGRRVA